MLKTKLVRIARATAVLLGALMLIFGASSAAQAAPTQSGGWVTTYTATGGVKVTDGQTTYGWEPRTGGGVHVLSASGCNQNVCIDIQGTRTYVDYFNTQAFGNVGCIRAHHRVNGASIFNSALICPSSSQQGVYYSTYHYGGNFFNNDVLCATWDKIAGKPCETIQR